jgi:hypothetical protein
MAAGDSSTSISNLALAMLGEDPIANVDPPDNSKRARLCYQFYDSSRRGMLEAHPWRCAKRQVQIAAAALAPAFAYGAAYPAPADFIRFFDLPVNGHQRWEMMNLADIGLCIVTDMTGATGGTLDVDYVFDLRDTARMTPLLVKIIAADMAANMAWPLARDMSLKAQCESDREAYLATARTISAQQASPRRFDADVLLRSRW